MAKGFIPVNSRSLSEERRVRDLVRSVTVTKRSTKKIETLYEKFRDICKQIRVATNIRRFRGTYDEVIDLYKASPSVMPQELDKLLNMWRVIDSAVKVEAEKLGYTGDRWLKDCWRAEIVRDEELSNM